MKGISQGFSDCGLHNYKYTKYLPNKNCVNRTLSRNFRGFRNLLDVLMQGAIYCDDGFIAAIYSSAKVWVSWLKIKFGEAEN